MAMPRRGPSDEDLIRWHAEGLTQQEMLDAHIERGGETVTLSAISQSMRRLGLSARRVRWSRAVPWRVRDDHSKRHEANMLRALEARQRGERISDRRNRELDNFLIKLKAKNSVIGYTRNSEKGFYYVARETVPPDLIDEEFPIIKS